MPAFNKNDFSGNPVRLDIARSKFSMPFKHKTTFTAGKLIPIFSYGDVLPGDTFQVDMASLVRMVTPVFPTMDDAYMDVYFFFTPHKLTLGRQMMSPAVNDAEHSWNAFIGAQDSLLNTPTPAEVLLPCVYIGKGSSDSAEVGSLTDYLGLGLAGRYQAISCLEPLAYYAIWNHYFRDENTMNPIVYSLSGASTSQNPHITGRKFISFSGFDGESRWYTNGQWIGGKGSILPVCRPHGYFGSALPWPQRNLDMVNIPLSGLLPVIDDTGHKGANVGDSYRFGGFRFNDFFSGDLLKSPVILGVGNNSTAGDIGYQSGDNFIDVDGIFGKGVNSVTGSMLTADAGAGNASIAVNALRLAVQTQRWFEALARGGNRIGEISSSMFGVTPSDYAQDRPEYLGGKRIPISIDQVANTAGPGAGGDGQTLGSLGAYSNTGDSGHYFTKSFDTWGTITCVICVRTNESFTQGIPRRYERKSRFDFYWPQFANLGEQPIYKSELYIPNDYSQVQDEVFGYQEAWAEYRYLPDIVSGELRPDKTLGAYTYANLFTTFPTLAGYIDGTKIIDNVDQTLTVKSSASGFQFIGDFAFNIVVTRPMPRYSIPGLVDHH